MPNTMQHEEGNTLDGQDFIPMGTSIGSSRVMRHFESFMNRVLGEGSSEEKLRVMWLSGTLFFIVGAYWLLRSIKDPIMSAIDGVEYIPQAKIASLVVVFSLVVVYNELLDRYPIHELFYYMGICYGVLFGVISLLLMHPEIGLPNESADPSRLLGWISYVSIESFGSMLVQCFWALVNATVDTNFGKKYFGKLVAGAQIGAIIGPSLATQAHHISIPGLYIFGASTMFLMVASMHYYIIRFGTPPDPDADGDETSGLEQVSSKEGEGNSSSSSSSSSSNSNNNNNNNNNNSGNSSSSSQRNRNKKGGGIYEGFQLFFQYYYVQGLFAVSSLYMVQLTIVDYTLKVLARERYNDLHPDDSQAALTSFASFMGMFGILTNSIALIFSLLGTGMIIDKYGLTNSLIAFPVCLGICAVAIYFFPTIWTVLGVMMAMKAMGYALNNPAKEILYQSTSLAVKSKAKSLIDTFGQRSSKALGSVFTNAFADSVSSLINYGTLVGIGMSALLIYIAQYMGTTFEYLQSREEKIGEEPQRGFDGLMMTDIYKDRKLDAEDVDAAPIYSNNNRNENEV